MKKLILIASVLMVGFNLMSQNSLLKNGGFENGKLIEGTKNVVEGNDWFYMALQHKVPGSKIALSSTEKNQGKTSLKMTATGEIPARFCVSISKALGIVPSLKYTLTFYAKSNMEVKLNCFYNGSFIKDGESKSTSSPGDVINISGNNKWEKYTLKVTGKMFSGGGAWDFSKKTDINIGLEKQVLSGDLELYLDDIELM